MLGHAAMKGDEENGTVSKATGEEGGDLNMACINLYLHY